MRHLACALLCLAVFALCSKAHASVAEAEEAIVRKDYVAARQLLEQPARDGDAVAEDMLGHMLLFGRGGGVDANQAEALLRRAAEKGRPEAQNSMGVLYMTGINGTIDPIQGIAWFRKAAENGHAYAMFNMGRAAEQGLGMKKSRTEAAAWYARSASKGSEAAKIRLEELQDRHSPDKKKQQGMSYRIPSMPREAKDPDSIEVFESSLSTHLIAPLQDKPVDSAPSPRAMASPKPELPRPNAPSTAQAQNAHSEQQAAKPAASSPPDPYMSPKTPEEKPSARVPEKTSGTGSTPADPFVAQNAQKSQDTPAPVVPAAGLVQPQSAPEPEKPARTPEKAPAQRTPQATQPNRSATPPTAVPSPEQTPRGIPNPDTARSAPLQPLNGQPAAKTSESDIPNPELRNLRLMRNGLLATVSFTLINLTPPEPCTGQLSYTLVRPDKSLIPLGAQDTAFIIKSKVRKSANLRLPLETPDGSSIILEIRTEQSLIRTNIPLPRP